MMGVQESSSSSSQKIRPGYGLIVFIGGSIQQEWSYVYLIVSGDLTSYIVETGSVY